MSLPAAIAQLEEELGALGLGKRPPAEGSADWFLVRAKALGLSHLRALQEKGLAGDLESCEKCYKGCLKHHKKDGQRA